MALAQSLRSLLHSEQLADLRSQADALISKTTDKVAAKAAPVAADVASSTPVQGLLAYLPTILEYAGLFRDVMYRGADRASQGVAAAASAAPEVRKARRGWRAARPYVYGTVAVGALGYAAYLIARNRRA